MVENNCKWIVFTQGNLSGLSLFTTEAFSKIYKNGDTDREMISIIEDGKPSGKTIFDVGAFIGASSLVFSKLVGDNGAVVAFEPNPYNLKRMRKNIKGNSKFGDRIKMFSFALSDNNNSTRMFLSKSIDNGYSSTSRIANSHSSNRDEDLPKGFINVNVDNRKLDDFIKETKLKPDIIKIDVEGAEHLFLIGALNTLKTHQPTLFIEIHSEYCAIRCYEILRDNGYVVSIINEVGDGRMMIQAIYSKNINKTNFSIDKRECILKLQVAQDLLSSQTRKIDSSEEKLKNIINTSDKKDKEISNMKKTLDSLKNEIKLKKGELEGLYGSKSWKITKPARGINFVIKNTRNRFTK